MFFFKVIFNISILKQFENTKKNKIKFEAKKKINFF